MAARSGRRALEEKSWTESPVAAAAVVLVTVPETVTLPFGGADVRVLDAILVDIGCAGPPRPGPAGPGGPAPGPRHAAGRGRPCGEKPRRPGRAPRGGSPATATSSPWSAAPSGTSSSGAATVILT